MNSILPEVMATYFTQLTLGKMKARMLMALTCLLLSACGPKIVYHQDTRPLTITHDYDLNWVDALPLNIWRDPARLAIHAEWSPDGKRLITDRGLGNLMAWDMEKRQTIGKVDPKSFSGPRQYQFSNDSQYLAMTSNYELPPPNADKADKRTKQRIRIYDAKSLQWLWDIDDCNCFIFSFSPDSKRLYTQHITRSYHEAIKIKHGDAFTGYDLATRKMVATTDFVRADLICDDSMKIGRQGQHILAKCNPPAGDSKQAITAINLQTGKLHELANPGAFLPSFGVSADGMKAAIASSGLAPIRIWSLEREEIEREITSPWSGYNNLDFIANTPYLVGGESSVEKSKNRGVNVINVDTGKLYARIEYQDSKAIWQAVPSPDGKQLAVVRRGLVSIFKLDQQSSNTTQY